MVGLLRLHRLGLRGFDSLVGTFPAIQHSKFRAYYDECQQFKVFLRSDYICTSYSRAESDNRV